MGRAELLAGAFFLLTLLSYSLLRSGSESLSTVTRGIYFAGCLCSALLALLDAQGRLATTLPNSISYPFLLKPSLYEKTV